jgi:HK97 family phage portal protein
MQSAAGCGRRATQRFNGGRTDSGIRVSELTALQIATVYSCVDLISGAMAATDLNVYEQLDPAGKRLAFEQDLHFILHDEPNEEMTSFTFIKTFMAHALLWTNAYAEIERDKAGRVLGLWPRSPIATKPRRVVQPILVQGEMVQTGKIIYETTDGGQVEEQNTPRHPRLILASNMLHVPGLSLDGRLGKPVIELTRQVMGLSLAAEKFGGKYFANGIRPSGVVEIPYTMEPKSMENFRRSIQEAQGGENMLRPMVLEKGMVWKQYDIKPNEAQWKETRSFQREEIGSIFHVPIRMLGESGRVNRSSAEQEAIELVQYTLRPWYKPLQSEFKRKLFVKTGRNAFKFFPAFYYQEMLTPDSESRAKLITVLKQWGLANTDDIREKFLDWNPIGGPAGETYWMPVNMMDASDPLKLSPGDPNSITGEDGSADSGEGDDAAGAKKPKQLPEPEDQRFARLYSRVFQDALQRVLARDKAELRDFQKAFTPVLSALADILTQVHAHQFGLESVNLEEPPAGCRAQPGPASPEVSAFVQEYIAGMSKRTWTDEAKAGELARAVKAIKIAVYRDLATRKAKQESNHEEQDRTPQLED